MVDQALGNFKLIRSGLIRCYDCGKGIPDTVRAIQQHIESNQSWQGVMISDCDAARISADGP